MPAEDRSCNWRDEHGDLWEPAYSKTWWRSSEHSGVYSWDQLFSISDTLTEVPRP